MSEIPIIEQPQSGAWFNPGDRMGHLIACYAVTSKEMYYDQLSEKDKERASFTMVDLDAECLEMTMLDNHPGIVNKLKVGNPAVVLGRIGAVPTARKDAYVLGEHGPGDAERLTTWWANGKRPGGKVPAPARNLGNAQEVPAPAPRTPAPPVPAPVAGNGGIDLAGFDPATVQLLLKKYAEEAAAGK